MRTRALTCSVLLALGPACRRAPQVEPYTPGLGEMMTLQQMRHTKLWLAGDAGNWTWPLTKSRSWARASTTSSSTTPLMKSRQLHRRTPSRG